MPLLGELSLTHMGLHDIELAQLIPILSKAANLKKVCIPIDDLNDTALIPKMIESIPKLEAIQMLIDQDEYEPESTSGRESKDPPLLLPGNLYKIQRAARARGVSMSLGPNRCEDNYSA
jgi:hypothetical protein